MTSVTLSILVPVYNEQYLVRTSLERLKLLVDSPLLERIEVIVVDDGSTDGTNAILRNFESIEATRPNSKLDWIFVYHEASQGKAAAIQTALKRARAELTVIYDADLEYHPLDLLKMVQVFMEEQADGHGMASFGNRFFISLTPLFIFGLALLLQRFAGFFRLANRAFATTSVLLLLFVLWNLGFIFQWGAHLISPRGPVSFSQVAYNQLFVVPRQISADLQRYLFKRRPLMQQIEQKDVEQLKKDAQPELPGRNEKPLVQQTAASALLTRFCYPVRDDRSALEFCALNDLGDLQSFRNRPAGHPPAGLADPAHRAAEHLV
jgi:glycosyltransferase involved in cell wall biosynthesis